MENNTKPNVAIIGAGLAGLTVANKLKNVAHVTVFEKSRGVGGRLATRYAETYKFDHGAQFFTVKTDEFQEYIQPLLKENIIVRWDACFVEFKGSEIVQKRQWDSEYPHYVGNPKMNEVGKYLEKELHIRLNTKIETITKKGKDWELIDADGNTQGVYNIIVVASPAQQTLELLPPYFKHYSAVSNLKMQGCFTLMLGFKEPLPLNFDAALVKEADISWISVNSSKPNRTEPYSLVVHATNNWADEHIEDSKTDVQTHLLKELERILGIDVKLNLVHNVIHRWRYANITKQHGDPAMYDSKNKIGICGDWLIQGRVESAFTSGNFLAQEIVKKL